MYADSRLLTASPRCPPSPRANGVFSTLLALAFGVFRSISLLLMAYYVVIDTLSLTERHPLYSTPSVTQFSFFSYPLRYHLPLPSDLSKDALHVALLVYHPHTS